MLFFNRFLQVSKLCLALMVLILPLSTMAQEEKEINAHDWPREIETAGGKIVIYQPQPETFKGDKMEARAAVSVTPKGKDAPIFGAIWFSTRVATDFTERIVTLLDVQVSAVKFPSGEEADIQKLSRLLETEIPKWDLVISLDQLLTSLEMVDMEKEMVAKFNNSSPEIIFVDHPAVLVTIDGEPKLKGVENSKLQYVVNTPFFIAKDGRWYYLFGGGNWYKSNDVEGEWQNIEKPSKDVTRLFEQSQVEEAPPDTVETGEATIPEIIVKTASAELIMTDGDPKYTPIEGTQLLYLSNTESDVIMDISTQTYYVLLAGRWYRSNSMLDGKWAFIANDKLPEDFPNIPAKSDMSDVLPSIAGTQEAKEAVLENHIPQTAAIDRKEAKLTVGYDGEPKFIPIEGTEMHYAVNTDKSVLKIATRYYCCDNAVWFVGISPKGPWEVCTQVPKEVQTIPPESPVYNVKYVYIYDSTPDVVYVGYTPGYLYSYIYHGCVVYGTGWYYRPWYGYYYYPRPVTWGFGVHYNPWTGWGFSFGVSYGWLNIGFGTWRRPHYGWWGPAGWRYGYRHGYHRGYRHGYHAGSRAGFRAGNKYAHRQQNINNVYRNRSTGVKTTVDRSRRPQARPATRDRSQAKNNVLVDRNGSVHRKTDAGWQQREKGRWQDVDRDVAKKSKPDRAQSVDRSRPSRDKVQQPQKQQRPSQQPAYDRSQRNRDLDRNSYNRSRGQQRTHDFQSQRRSYQRQPSQRPSRSGGGRGGGRRR